jgi:hypothetical protein
MRARRAIIVAFAGALGAASGCTGAGTPEETLEAFHGHMAAKDFTVAAGLVCYPEPGAGREETAARLAQAYDADDLDYGRAEIRERRRLGPEEVEFTVAYPARSRPSTPYAVRRVTLMKMRGGWYVVPETTEPTEPTERSD